MRVVRDIPDWFTDKTELFTSIRFVDIWFLCRLIFILELLAAHRLWEVYRKILTFSLQKILFTVNCLMFILSELLFIEVNN